ncbi:hypothetical protein SEUBUCD650_0N01520 [Saccharomyces eubayanus]|uniref:AMP-activated protein kinase glycogen-binding domain-containing protein n=1 Tax=Saccharomyces eubayanus TaxID=1080349 RepID=A0ABN8VH59_SACEU|nr:hypothetical protein SEUBUCD650_0N01520 [Saccharomyces eubayanus]
MQSGLLQFTFKWPKGPQSVVLTGAFDEWKGSLPMVKNPSGAFEITLPVQFDDPGDKFYFKFIVDGQWLTNKDYRADGNVEGKNNFITKEDIIQKCGSKIGTLVPESAGLAVSKNTTLTEQEGDKKPAKLRKFKIKRVIKTNKETGERSIFSQKVIELPDSEDEDEDEDEAQQTVKNAKNVDGLSGTTTIIGNTDGGVEEEKAVKPYEEKHPNIGLVKSEETATDHLGKTQSSDSRLYELSAEELEEEEEEEEEEKEKEVGDSSRTAGMGTETREEKPLNETTIAENPQEAIPVGTATVVKEAPGKLTSESKAETQTLEGQQNPPAITAKTVGIKGTTRTAKPGGAKGVPHKEAPGSSAKKGGFFKKLGQLLK